MSVLKITAMPTVYKEGGFELRFNLRASDNNYRELVEVKTIFNVHEAVLRARKALAGTDSIIFATIVQGRKPNGFDAWYNEQRYKALQVREGASSKVAA